MLNTETDFRIERAVRQAQAHSASQADVVQYISDMLKDLHGMAHKSGLSTVAHMLSIAKLSADEAAEELRQAGS